MIVVVNSQMHIPTRVDYHLSKHHCIANPYTHLHLKGNVSKYRVKSPEEALNAFRKHLNDKIESKDKEVIKQLNRIYKMAIKGDVFLVCRCKPKPCHADIIKEIVEANIIYNPIELEAKRKALLKKREVIAASIFDVMGNPTLVHEFRKKMSMLNGLLEEIELQMTT